MTRTRTPVYTVPLPMRSAPCLQPLASSLWNDSNANNLFCDALRHGIPRCVRLALFTNFSESGYCKNKPTAYISLYTTLEHIPDILRGLKIAIARQRAGQIQATAPTSHLSPLPAARPVLTTPARPVACNCNAISPPHPFHLCSDRALMWLSVSTSKYILSQAPRAYLLLSGTRTYKPTDTRDRGGSLRACRRHLFVDE
ncbi:hypothetical protein BOTBODRAFT_39789 [Botryobasidium botryosum FD-172 SS1]|uniref:Uncharacterized protein n=1 Tax=Botryobasidium botryosum (strain FD-172 SS1) TaxID=930990 RepID=A0A067LSB8_BOTB1|nr:hypothetical protein BOTBODRAFT_39789 [Botryobasidium botryosum FD-172 SS1]